MLNTILNTSTTTSLTNHIKNGKNLVTIYIGYISTGICPCCTRTLSFPLKAQGILIWSWWTESAITRSNCSCPKTSTATSKHCGRRNRPDSLSPSLTSSGCWSERLLYQRWDMQEYKLDYWEFYCSRPSRSAWTELGCTVFYLYTVVWSNTKTPLYVVSLLCIPMQMDTSLGEDGPCKSGRYFSI